VQRAELDAAMTHQRDAAAKEVVALRRRADAERVRAAVLGTSRSRFVGVELAAMLSSGVIHSPA
jgi:hypothetical protein